MKIFLRNSAVSGLVAFLAAVAVVPAGAAEPCATGGVLIRVAVDKDKALAWFEKEKLPYLLSEADGWRIVTLSSKTRDIGSIWGEDFVFYGVADNTEREASTRRMNKAFGNNLEKLRKAVRDELRQLRKDRVVAIEGEDVAKISAAVGLGTLSRDGRDWRLETGDCEAVTVDVSVAE